MLAPPHERAWANSMEPIVGVKRQKLVISWLPNNSSPFTLCLTENVNILGYCMKALLKKTGGTQYIVIIL